MVMTFRDFDRKHVLKNKTTSNIIIQQVLSSLFLNDIGIFLRDGPFPTDIGIVKGTHWVCYINEIYFDGYGCSPSQKLHKNIIKRYGYCLNSEYQIRKNDSFCGNFCLNMISLIKVIGTNFRYAVLTLYYQMIKK